MEVAGTGIRVAHRSDVAELRRRAAELCTGLDMDAAAVGRVTLVATELATNVLKHAQRGWCYVSPAPGAPRAVDLLATDRGGGIADLEQALGNGHSTAGTPGTGIGAIRRQSTEFDVYSQSGVGTVFAARVGPDPTRGVGESGQRVRARGFQAPVSGERVCGDAWGVRGSEEGRTDVLVADGLGHGPGASDASAAAIRTFMTSRRPSPASLIEEIHGALGRTRGAAVATAWIDPAAGTIRFAGIGNISAAIVSGGSGRSMATTNGTAGYVARAVQEFEYEAPPGALVVLHSDGLKSRWDLDPYPGLERRGPAIIAGVLLRDFSRGRDDVSVVVARVPAAPGGGG